MGEGESDDSHSDVGETKPMTFGGEAHKYVERRAKLLADWCVDADSSIDKWVMRSPNHQEESN